MHLRTIEWIGDEPGKLIPGKVRFIDQVKLPAELVYIETADVREVHASIRALRVRGAPAIGIAGAMGVVAAIQSSGARTGPELVRSVE
jgi:methylthioribose-1-phosphate isomerase